MIHTGLGVTKAQGAQAAGAAALSIAPYTGPAAIFVAIGGAITELAGAIFTGCGATCTQSTAIVNQIEPYLKQNLAAYMALATPRPVSAQTAAEGVFNTAWTQVLNACSSASLGKAGQACIADRQRGGKWDWFAYYYDPIANDKNVYDDSVGTTVSGTTSNIISDVGSLFSTGSSSTSSSWLWPVLILGAGLMLMGSNGK